MNKRWILNFFGILLIVLVVLLVSTMIYIKTQSGKYSYDVWHCDGGIIGKYPRGISDGSTTYYTKDGNIYGECVSFLGCDLSPSFLDTCVFDETARPPKMIQILEVLFYKF